MYTVYVLKDNDGNLYKGYTNNIIRRLYEHTIGHTQTTRKMKDLIIVYSEEYVNLEDALKRERYLKSAAGRKFLKTKLNIEPAHSSVGRADPS